MVEYGLQWSSTGHKGPINCISFTEDGSYLASGSDDGHVLVWAMQDGSLLQRLKPKQGPVVAVKWFTGGPPHSEPSTKVCYLLSAGANGTVVIWCFNMTLALFEWVHMETVFDSAIECVTLDETHSVLAVATLGRIATYQLSKSNRLAMHLLQVHPPLSQSRLPSLPISAHFSDRGHTLMVAFLDSREIVAWDITPWKQLWHQKIRTRIGSMAYHDGTKMLLVWNLIDGFDAYQLVDEPNNRLLHIRHFRVKIRRNRICQLQFDLDGKTVITGSDNGRVVVWDISTGKQLQVLHHSEELYGVQVVNYHALQFTKHYIASGSSDAGEEQSLLRLWSTEVPSTQLNRTEQESLTNNVPTPIACRHIAILLLMVSFFMGFISFQVYSRPTAYFRDGL
ncbi:WD40-repeat-containing domain protein [Pisolithus albus]|nr:WD40-repeat-containing domain protein [Pisolithus albus]